MMTIGAYEPRPDIDPEGHPQRVTGCDGELRVERDLFPLVERRREREVLAPAGSALDAVHPNGSFYQSRVGPQQCLVVAGVRPMEDELKQVVVRGGSRLDGARHHGVTQRQIEEDGVLFELDAGRIVLAFLFFALVGD